jgi:hypothetical protein
MFTRVVVSGTTDCTNVSIEMCDSSVIIEVTQDELRQSSSRLAVVPNRDSDRRIA